MPALLLVALSPTLSLGSDVLGNSYYWKQIGVRRYAIAWTVAPSMAAEGAQSPFTGSPLDRENKPKRAQVTTSVTDRSSTFCCTITIRLSCLLSHPPVSPIPNIRRVLQTHSETAPNCRHHRSTRSLYSPHALTYPSFMKLFMGTLNTKRKQSEAGDQLLKAPVFVSFIKRHAVVLVALRLAVSH